MTWLMVSSTSTWIFFSLGDAGLLRHLDFLHRPLHLHILNPQHLHIYPIYPTPIYLLLLLLRPPNRLSIVSL